MAVQLTSSPVNFPSGIRATTGTFDFNNTNYTTGGIATTIAQWGGGSNGIPNRFPDFVLFSQPSGNTASPALPTAADTAVTVFRYVESSGKVQVAGEELLTADSGMTEADAEAWTGTGPKARFLAIWLESAASTVT